MDYRIDFSAAENGGILTLLRRLADRSSLLERRGDTFILSNTTTLAPTLDGGPAVNLIDASDGDLFDLLQLYFDDVAGTDHGALVTFSQEGVVTIIAFSNEDDMQAGEMPLGFVVPATEMLLNREVFLAAWPNLREYGTVQEDFEETEDRVVVT